MTRKDILGKIEAIIEEFPQNNLHIAGSLLQMSETKERGLAMLFSVLDDPGEDVMRKETAVRVLSNFMSFTCGWDDEHLLGKKDGL